MVCNIPIPNNWVDFSGPRNILDSAGHNDGTAKVPLSRRVSSSADKSLSSLNQAQELQVSGAVLLLDRRFPPKSQSVRGPDSIEAAKGAKRGHE